MTPDVVLAGMLGNVCFVYMYDNVIYSKCFDEHLEDIENVFGRRRGAGLKLKPSKCQLLRENVKYLGHTVLALGVKPYVRKLECV